MRDSPCFKPGSSRDSASSTAEAGDWRAPSGDPSELQSRSGGELPQAAAPAKVLCRDINQAQDCADTLVASLNYIRKYQEYSAIVMKIGGSLMDSPDALTALAQDACSMQTLSWRPVIVHGGGLAISAALKTAGVKTSFDATGHRITTEAEIPIVDGTLSEITRDIVAQINAGGGHAQALHGPDIFRCVKKTSQGADLGFVGRIVEVDIEPIVACLQRGVVPVVSPTARGREDGKIYNVNADTSAEALARAINKLPRARLNVPKRLLDEDLLPARMMFLMDVPGVLKDINDPTSAISLLTLRQVDELIADGTIGPKFLPKIQGGLDALTGGVGEVSFVDGRVVRRDEEGRIKGGNAMLELLTPNGLGTMLIRGNP